MTFLIKGIREVRTEEEPVTGNSLVFFFYRIQQGKD
jgi:hypothetical protein